MYSIHIANEQRVLRVDRARLVRVAESTLASERVRAADISVALVDDARIHEINRDFLGHDYPTDVISFLLDSEEPPREKRRKRGSRQAARTKGRSNEFDNELTIGDPLCRERPPWRSTNQSGPTLSKAASRNARGSAQRPIPTAPKPPASSPKPSPRGAGKSLGGEIIISVETAVTMAADYGWRPSYEVSLYLVHGLLHLCGYDDLTPLEQQLMRRREVEVLAPWKIVPSYAV